MISKSLNHKSMVSTQIYTKVDLDPIRESLERASSAMFAAGRVIQDAEVVPMPSRTDQEGNKLSEVSNAQCPLEFTKFKRN